MNSSDAANLSALIDSKDKAEKKSNVDDTALEQGEVAIDELELRPKVYTSCIDKCPCLIRELFQLISGIFGVLVLVGIILPLLLILTIFSCIWKYFLCECCDTGICCNKNNQSKYKYKKIYSPKCNSCTRNFFHQWRLHLVTTKPKSRCLCFYCQDSIVSFYSFFEFAVNANSIIDLFGALSDRFGDNFIFNNGVVISDPDTIVDLIVNKDTLKPASVLALTPSTESKTYTLKSLPRMHTLTDPHTDGRFVLHEFFASFYKTYVYPDGNNNNKSSKDWYYIAKQIENRCQALIPQSTNEEKPDINDLYHYSARLLFFLMTDSRLEQFEEDNIVSYCKIQGASLFSDWISWLFGGKILQRKVVSLHNLFRNVMIKRNTNECLQPIIKASRLCKDYSDWEGLGNIVRAFLINVKTLADLTNEALIHLYSDPEKWVNIFDENPYEFIREACRLKSPVPIVTFIKDEPEILNINGKKERIPSGTPIILPLILYNRNPNIFEFNNIFNPHRKNLDKIISWMGPDNTIEHPIKGLRPPRYCPGRDFSIAGSWYLINALKPKFVKKLNEKKAEKITLNKLDKQTQLMLNVFGKAGEAWKKDNQNIYERIDEPHDRKRILKKETKLWGSEVVIDGEDEDWPPLDLKVILATNLLQSKIYPINDIDTKFKNIEEGINWLRDALGDILPEPNIQWKELRSNHGIRQLCFAGLCAQYLTPILNYNDELKLDKYLPNECKFVTDFTMLDRFKVRKGLEIYGAKCYFNSKCELIGIYVSYLEKYFKAIPDSQYIKETNDEKKDDDDDDDNDKILNFKTADEMTKEEFDWEHAKWVFRVSMGTFITFVDHLSWVHYREASSQVIAYRECLSPKHPLRRFLKPFTFRVISINSKAAGNLVAERGPVHRAWGFPYNELVKALRYSQNLYRFRKLEDWFHPKINELLTDYDYPLLTDGKEYWNIILKLVKNYFKIYYKSDDQILSDNEIKDYFSLITIQLGIASNFNSVDKLFEIITQLIVSGSGIHEHVGVVIDYLQQIDFFGSKIRRGEIYCDIQSYAQTFGVAILTGLRQPKMLEIDFMKFHKTGEKNKDILKQLEILYQDYRNDLLKLIDTIDERNKNRIQATNSFNPRNLETSVSI